MKEQKRAQFSVYNRIAKEFAEAEQILDDAMQLVELDKENHLFRDKHSNYTYFTMRQNQFTILENMLPLATRLPQKDDVSTLVASSGFSPSKILMNPAHCS